MLDRIFGMKDENDDQCIHKMELGVSVENFINACDNIEVLKQLVELQCVTLFTTVLLKRLCAKDIIYVPGLKIGNLFLNKEVSTIVLQSLFDVDIDQGSWTIMARTNKIVQNVAESLRDDGYLSRQNSAWSEL